MDNEYLPKIRDIITWPDERLHTKCQDITVFNDSIKHLVTDMFVTMVAADGIGLAAPQIGEFVNVIVTRVTPDTPMVFINPTILESSEEEITIQEGCLSVPGYFEKRKRPKSIVVRCLDLEGKEHEYQLLDLHAFTLQHEIEHLEGKVFVDGASRLKRSRIEKKVKKALKLRAEEFERARESLVTQTL